MILGHLWGTFFSGVKSSKCLKYLSGSGVPKGIRTPVAGVKGRCPDQARRWGRNFIACSNEYKYLPQDFLIIKHKIIQ